MKTYEIKFNARKKGAIGISLFYIRIIKAPNSEEAILKLYEEFEHIFLPKAKEIVNDDV